MELSTQIPKRIEWIDIFKGLAIFFMVIGHAASPINGYIYLFHMGAFLFISGYTSNLDKVHIDVLCIKKAIALLLPYYSISFVSILLLGVLKTLNFYEVFFENGYINFKDSMNLLFQGYNVAPFLGATWFLLVLFNVFILQKLILICTKNKVNLFYFIFSAGFIIVGYYLVGIKISSPKLMIDLVFIAQFYFSLGLIFNKYSNSMNSLLKKNRIIKYVFLIVSIVLIYYFKNINYSGVDYPSREFGNLINNVLATVSGIFILISISKLLARTAIIKRQLILFGRNTLSILFFHFLYFKLFFIIISILFNLNKEVWFAKYIPDGNNNYWLIISLFSIYLSVLTWKLLQKINIVAILLGSNKSYNQKIINKYRDMKSILTLDKRRRFELFNKKTYLKIFNYIFLIVFIYIFCEIIFNQYTVYWTKNNIFILLVGIVLLAYCLKKLFDFLRISTNKILYIIIGICASVILILQCFFAINFKVTPTWDFGILYNEALSISQGNTISHYFYDYYPNNIGALMLYNGIFKICNMFGYTNYLNALIFVNIVFINTSLICLLYFIKQLYPLYMVAFMSLILIFITPFYCYTTIVYTDTLTMIFPILSFLLYYMLITKELKLYVKILYVILIGFLLAVGSIIKMNVIIALVAMLIHCFFTQKNKKFILITLGLVALFIGVNKYYVYQAEKIIPIKYEDAGLPATHWIMMGLKENGRYNLDEANYSISLKDSGYSNKEIIEEHLKIIKSRLKEYGFLGMIDHINEKIDFTWGDGTYYSLDKLSREPQNRNPFQTYIFGENKDLFINLNQVVHFVVLIGIILSAIANIYKINAITILSNITLFGVFLFLLIWETRSRYIVLYIPVLLLSMINGYYFLFNLINQSKNKEFKNE
ncbi:acyltransferase family protein [Turicibacter sanguinis]|uniref:acyltransferase family protein n=1 Tax=Turicibacter sanguinis TaxID=154288 RepID=UPI0018AADF00|nr:acyltransferase family protein [Turicibacter sanguinis]